MLQVEKVGTVTKPVTHVEVVAVNKASIKGTDLPSAELIGSDKRTLPTKTVIKKLNRMICDDDKIDFFFIR